MDNSTHEQFHLWKIPPIRALTTETTYKGFEKYAVDANLFQLGSSILKYAGSRGTAPRGVWGANHPIKFCNQLDKILGQFFFSKRGQIYMKDAESAESTENSIF